MDLTFQVPMQYCSLQHQTLLSSPDTSDAKSHFTGKDPDAGKDRRQEETGMTEDEMVG